MILCLVVSEDWPELWIEERTQLSSGEKMRETFRHTEHNEKVGRSRTYKEEFRRESEDRNYCEI